MSFSKQKQRLKSCSSVSTIFLIIFTFELVVYGSYEKRHYYRRYRPTQYYRFRNDLQPRTLVKKIEYSQNGRKQHVETLHTGSGRAIVPKRRIIYSVAKPIRVRKILSEENGRLIYKEVSKQSSAIPNDSGSMDKNGNFNHSISNPQTTPPLPDIGQSIKRHRLRYSSTGIFHSQIRNTNLHRRPMAHPRSAIKHLVPTIFDAKKYTNKNVRRKTILNDEEVNPALLNGLVPPPGLRVVMVNGDEESRPVIENEIPLNSDEKAAEGIVQSAPSTSYTSFLATDEPFPLYSPSTKKVLRIQVASLEEARALLANVGPGFKVKVLNETELKTTTARTELDVTTKPFSSTTSRGLLSATLLNNAEVHRSSKLSNYSIQWWKRKNVCVEESPGLFGLSQEILRLIKTTTTCRKKRNRYVCIESYGFGKHSPTKTTTYRCCSGYKLSKKKQECVRRPRHRLKSSRYTSKRSKKTKETSSLAGRSSPDAEAFTIFMPGDDVVRAAFLFEDDSSSLVQNFLENHVIPKKKLLLSQLHDDEMLTALSGNQIRINFFPYDLETVMTVNCRKVKSHDNVHDNTVIHFIEKIIDNIQGTIYDYLIERSDNFSSFLSVLNATNLQNKLQAENGSFTLLVPSNEAFQDIFDINGDAESCLKALALNHVIDSVQCSAGPEGSRRNVTTLQNERLEIRHFFNETFVNEARIITRDVMTNNGVIHVIDQVLKPNSGFSVLDVLMSSPMYSSALKMFEAAGVKEGLETGDNLTAIVPYNRAFKKAFQKRLSISDGGTFSNTMMFHLVPSKLNLEDLISNVALETMNPPHNIHVRNYPMKVRVQVPSGKRKYIRKTATSLQCARIIAQPDIAPCNGAIFVVNQVLQPPAGSLLSAMMYTSRSNFSTFLKALKRSGLEKILDGDNVLTVFAPSEAAFSRFPAQMIKRLLKNRRLLIRVLKYHVISGFHCEHELLQRPYRHKTMLRSSVLTCPKRRKIYLGRQRKRLRGKVVNSNIVATNGVIHAIDNLLLPRNFRLF